VYVAQAQRWHPEIRRRADAEHQELSEAVQARDAERAIDVMRGHAGLPLEMTDVSERDGR
jgi:DNA-binding GntR family transcriptional regulator